MDHDHLKFTAQYLEELAADAMTKGKIRSSYGVHGHAVLLHDKLGRWLDATDDSEKFKESGALAVDALVMLALSIPKLELNTDAVRHTVEASEAAISAEIERMKRDYSDAMATHSDNDEEC